MKQEVGMVSIERVFENEDFVILNKPAGLIVHPARLAEAKPRQNGKTKEPSLADWVLENYPEAKNVGESAERPGIVHRLDRETSGVIVVAKNQKAFLHLKKEFQERKVKKTYRAFVYGDVKEDEGIIDRPIGKSKKDFRLWSAQRGAGGKLRDAITRYKVLNRGADQSRVGGAEAEATELELYPETGRTHQIRVHLKAINHPVVCDKLYAPKGECILGFERMALQAKKIEFEGFDGEEIEARISCPTDFKKARANLRHSKNIAE